MLTAQDIMNPVPPYCDLDTSIDQVSKKLADEHYSGLLVLDEEKRLMGVITESDLLEQQGKLHIPTAIALFDIVIPLGASRFEQELERMQALTAQDLMSGDVETVTPDAGLDAIAALMGEEHVHHLPVIDGEIVAGLITKHDVIKALAREPLIAPSA